jgi:hypothetical protein
MYELKLNSDSAKKSQKTWPAGEAESFNALSKKLSEDFSRMITLVKLNFNLRHLNYGQ